jgi:vacuolar-type H+-ATPase subunit E/Vma4
MALEELRRDIEHEARLAASKLEKEGDAEAATIIGNAKKSAETARKKAVEEAKLEAEHRKRDGLVSLETDISSMLSSAKEESIDRQMGQFGALVAKRLQASEQSLIKSAIASFSELMPLENSVIRIDKRNAHLVKHHGARIESAQIKGVVITSADKRVTADASIDGLIGSHGDEIRRTLSKAMFG